LNFKQSSTFPGSQSRSFFDAQKEAFQIPKKIFQTFFEMSPAKNSAEYFINQGKCNFLHEQFLFLYERSKMTSLHLI